MTLGSLVYKLKIELDKASLNSAVNLIKSGLNKAKTSLSGNDLKIVRFDEFMGSSLEATSKRIDATMKAAKDAKSAINEMGLALSAVGAAGVAGFAYVTNSFMEQEFAAASAASKMVRLGDTTDDVAEKIRRVRDAAQDAGRGLGLFTSETAGAARALGAAGWNIQQVESSLRPVALLKMADGMATMEQAADTVVDTMTALGIPAEQASKTIDGMSYAITTSTIDLYNFGESSHYLAPRMKRLNSDFADMAAIIGALGIQGIKGTLATRALGTGFDRFAKPTRTMLDVLDALDISLYDSKNSFIGIIPAIRVLEQALNPLPDKFKSGALAALVGADAVKNFDALINYGADNLQKYSDEIDKATGMNELMASVVSGTLKVSMKDAFREIDNLSASFGELNRGALLAAFSGLRKFAEAMNDISPGTKIFITNSAVAGTAIAGIAGATLLAGNQLLQFQGHIEKFGGLVGIMSTPVGKFASSLGAIGGFAVVATGAVLGLLTAMYQAKKGLLEYQKMTPDQMESVNNLDKMYSIINAISNKVKNNKGDVKEYIYAFKDITKQGAGTNALEYGTKSFDSAFANLFENSAMGIQSLNAVRTEYEKLEDASKELGITQWERFNWALIEARESMVSMKKSILGKDEKKKVEEVTDEIKRIQAELQKIFDKEEKPKTKSYKQEELEKLLALYSKLSNAQLNFHSNELKLRLYHQGMAGKTGWKDNMGTDFILPGGFTHAERLPSINISEQSKSDAELNATYWRDELTEIEKVYQQFGEGMASTLGELWGGVLSGAEDANKRFIDGMKRSFAELIAQLIALSIGGPWGPIVGNFFGGVIGGLRSGNSGFNQNTSRAASQVFNNNRNSNTIIVNNYAASGANVSQLADSISLRKSRKLVGAIRSVV